MDQTPPHCLLDLTVERYVPPGKQTSFNGLLSDSTFHSVHFNDHTAKLVAAAVAQVRKDEREATQGNTGGVVLGCGAEQRAPLTHFIMRLSPHLFIAADLLFSDITFQMPFPR